jgi:hypothetical protein
VHGLTETYKERFAKKPLTNQASQNQLDSANQSSISFLEDQKNNEREPQNLLLPSESARNLIEPEFRQLDQPVEAQTLT